MNTKQAIDTGNLIPDINIKFTKLAQRMQKLHHHMGETDACIESIQGEIKAYLPSHINGNELVQKLINPVQHKACQTFQHLIYRIIRTDKLKVALHLTTAGITIPIHSHPGDINALYIIEGAINLRQYSFVKSHRPDVRHFYLRADECNVGLQHFYNTHELETTEPLTAFFSIRCKTDQPKPSFLQRLRIPGWQGFAQIQ